MTRSRMNLLYGENRDMTPQELIEHLEEVIREVKKREGEMKEKVKVFTQMFIRYDVAE